MSFQSLALVFWQGDGISSNYWKMAITLSPEEYGDSLEAINAFTADVAARIYTRSTQLGLAVPANSFNADGTPKDLEFYAIKFAPAVDARDLEYVAPVYTKYVDSVRRYFREYRLAGSDINAVFDVVGNLYDTLAAKADPASAGGLIQRYRNAPPEDNTSSLDTFLYLSAGAGDVQADYEVAQSDIFTGGYYTSLGFNHDMVALVGVQAFPFLTLYEKFITVSESCYANINSMLWPGINPNYFNLRAFFMYVPVFGGETCDEFGNAYDVIFDIVRNTDPLTAGGVTDLFSEAFLFDATVYNYINTLFYQIESIAVGASYFSGNYINFVTAPSTYYISDDGAHLFRATSDVYMDGVVPLSPGGVINSYISMDTDLIFNGAINNLQDRVQGLEAQMGDLSFAWSQPAFVAAAQAATSAQIVAASTEPENPIYQAVLTIVGGSVDGLQEQIDVLNAKVAALETQVNPILLNAIAKALRINVSASAGI